MLRENAALMCMFNRPARGRLEGAREAGARLNQDTGVSVAAERVDSLLDRPRVAGSAIWDCAELLAPF